MEVNVGDIQPEMRLKHRASLLQGLLVKASNAKRVRGLGKPPPKWEDLEGCWGEIERLNNEAEP